MSETDGVIYIQMNVKSCSKFFKNRMKQSLYSSDTGKKKVRHQNNMREHIHSYTFENIYTIQLFVYIFRYEFNKELFKWVFMY